MYEKLLETYGFTMTVAEVASVLRMSRSRAYQQLRDGTFPIHGLKIGSRMLFDTKMVAEAFTGKSE